MQSGSTGLKYLQIMNKLFKNKNNNYELYYMVIKDDYSIAKAF